jgi:hypothetical protein
MGPPVFELDGHEFRSAEVGLTDAYTTIVLLLVVVGDTVNGDAPQYFGEANTTEQNGYEHQIKSRRLAHILYWK